MSKFMDILAHVFLPNRCMFCRKPVEYDKLICNECYKNAPTTDNSKCLICGLSECNCQYYFSYLLSPFYYELGADTAIRDLKFYGNMQNAKKLATCMVNCMESTSTVNIIDIIIPVPLYKSDMKKRGFNQAYELGKYVSRIIKKPILDNILVKIKETRKQHDITATERYSNLKDAFLVENQSEIRNKTILLIDDVFTTGSTMSCCAKSLAEAGAKEIICIVAAKTKYMVK